jgi:alpha-galactosidase
MPKIAFIGAGSAVFSKNIIADILSHPALADSEIVLVDIDTRRLDITLRLTQSINIQLGTNARLRATIDRRKALAGADFVISAIGVGGKDAIRTDLEIPLRFGLRQTVGDTLGIGGIFRSLRSVPVLLEICRDMEELCPTALLMNYSNPMATHVLAASRSTSIKIVGLCHGIVHTAEVMSMLIALQRLPKSEIEAHFQKPWNSPERIAEWERWLALGHDLEATYTCAGINHMAVFTRFESKGVDFYPELRKAMETPHLLRLDPIRIELGRWLGYFITETSGHCAEYLPYFLKSEAESARTHLRICDYLQTIVDLDQATEQLDQNLSAGKPPISTPYQRSVEYASGIINAVVTNDAYVFNGNVYNQGGRLVTNLAGDSCVEVPCVANAAGVTPTFAGEIPPQVAALIATNINVQDLTVRAILENSRDYVYQAAMVDPNTAATLTLPKIKELVDAMFEAHESRLPKAMRFTGRMMYSALSEPCDHTSGLQNAA